MTVRADENLSAFMDGELSDGEGRSLLATLTEDGELRGQWNRYHLIGEALRRGLPDQVDGALAERIHRRLAEEPTVLAPRRRSSLRRLQPYLKQAASLSIAAGVAVAAVLTVPQLMQSEPAVGPGPQIAQATPPMEGNAALMRASTRISPSSIPRRGVDRRLEEFLVDRHSRSPVADGPDGLPSDRIITYPRSPGQ